MRARPASGPQSRERRARAQPSPLSPRRATRRGASKLDLAQDGDRLREDAIVAPGRYSSHSMERLLRAAINTWHGLLAAARSEEAFRQELIALVVAVTDAFLAASTAGK